MLITIPRMVTGPRPVGKLPTDLRSLRTSVYQQPKAIWDQAQKYEPEGFADKGDSIQYLTDQILDQMNKAPSIKGGKFHRQSLKMLNGGTQQVDPRRSAFDRTKFER